MNPPLTPKDTLAMGFSAHMFGVDKDFFTVWLSEAIAEQWAYLQVRVGALQESAGAELQMLYRMALQNLCGAEMVRRRTTQLMALAVPNGEQNPLAELRAQRREYLEEAERWIGRITAGVVADDGGYCGSVVVSSHGLERR